MALGKLFVHNNNYSKLHVFKKKNIFQIKKYFETYLIQHLPAALILSQCITLV